jgi:hypothetical protein
MAQQKHSFLGGRNAFSFEQASLRSQTFQFIQCGFLESQALSATAQILNLPFNIPCTSAVFPNPLENLHFSVREDPAPFRA